MQLIGCAAISLSLVAAKRYKQMNILSPYCWKRRLISS